MDLSRRITPFLTRWLHLLRAAHPIQAVALATLLGALAALSGRSASGSLSAGLAVFVVQLALGLDNDRADAGHDYRAQTRGKPIARGQVHPADAGYWMIVLVLLAVPLSQLQGLVAGSALLLTLPLGWLNNHCLHRTVFSFVPWMGSFALYAVFLSYAGGANRPGDGGVQGLLEAAPPTWQAVASAALAGLTLHLTTSLRDLVTDHKSGARNLPLRLGLQIGAPRLLVVTLALAAASVAALTVTGLTVGVR